MSTHSSRTAAIPPGPASSPERMAIGIVILLLADIIWVASSEFTEYIFKDMDYDKPFFSTYFKTSLFTIYLTGFVFYRPWREQCSVGPAASFAGIGRHAQYRRLHLQINDDDDEDDILPPRTDGDISLTDDDDDDDDDDGDEAEEQEEINVAEAGEANFDGDDEAALAARLPRATRVGQVRRTPHRNLSSPTLVPVNIPDSGKSSGTEDSDHDRRASAQKRRVRFKHLAEVVEMNPAEAMAANLARLSYSASLQARAALRRAAARLSLGQVALLALFFCLPWFGGNYCYHKALSSTEAAVVNALSSSSSLFTLLLASIFPSDPGDRITLSKFVAVCFSLSGVVLVSYADMSIEASSDVPAGAMWSLLGAFFYALYIVLLRRKVNHEDNMSSPMFFGFVGLFNVLLLWPGLLLLHFLQKETFQLPTARQWEFMVVNGIIGTVLSELLWLWGCFLTSSLMATLATGLTIPLSIVADILWRHKSYEPIFLVGAIPMLCSFFVIAVLTHLQHWDPLRDVLRMVARRCRSCCSRSSAGNAGNVATLADYFSSSSSGNGDCPEREALTAGERGSVQDEAEDIWH